MEDGSVLDYEVEGDWILRSEIKDRKKTPQVVIDPDYEKNSQMVVDCCAAIGPGRAGLIHFVYNNTSLSHLNSSSIERNIVLPLN